MTASAPPRPLRITRFLPTRRAWWAIAAAFAAGVLLFLLLWMDKRDDAPAEGAPAAPIDAAGRAFAPLPAPLPAGTRTASGLDERAPHTPTRIDGQAPQPGGDAATTPPVAATASTPAAAAAAGTATGGPGPRVVSSPSPDYPRDALRRGIGGDVLLRIEVGANGRPLSVEVERSSQTRSLDRAAVRAVRRWRFEPAAGEGGPVPAVIRQTISFTPPQ